MRILKRAWRIWLKSAEILGNIQMVVLLSVIYWIVLPFIAIPFRILADPLSLRGNGRSRWVHRPSDPDILKTMRKQG